MNRPHRLPERIPEEQVETIQFPTAQPRRRRRPMFLYEEQTSHHSHWLCIVSLFVACIIFGAVLFKAGSWLWLPFCSLNGFAVSLACLYGVIKSALQK